MIKALLITGSLSLAVGTIGGYYLQKTEVIGSAQTAPAKSDEAIAATPKQIDLRPKPSKRSELELKYALCTDSKANPATLSRLDDKTLNDLVYQVCTK